MSLFHYLDILILLELYSKRQDEFPLTELYVKEVFFNIISHDLTTYYPPKIITIF